MKHVSLTGRLIAVVVICQLLLTAGLTIAAVAYGRAELLNAFDAALIGRATGVLALVRYTEGDPPGLLFDRSLLPQPLRAAHQDLFEIRGPDGEVVAQSTGDHGIPDSLLKASVPNATFRVNRRPYRAVALRNVAVLDDEEAVQQPVRVTVMYAASIAGMNEQLAEMAFYVAGTSLVLLAAASIVAAWGVRRGLQPLRELAAQAGAISVRNWSFHPPEDVGMAKELRPLAGAIRTVLDRLKESFRQQRDFTSDAAHELKTSVTILKSSLQSLLQRPRAEQEYRAGLEGSLEDCERLEDLLGRMLRLARIEQWAESGIPRKLGSTELTSTCEAAISRMQKVASGRSIDLKLVNSVHVHLRADPEDLELIWVNLLENALQYSPNGSEIILRVGVSDLGSVSVGNGAKVGNRGSMALVSVEDSGTGIPPAELPYIFERFRRGDPSRARSTGGFGLGLAICKALAEEYGGRMEALNRPEGGTVIRVELPMEYLQES